MKKVSIVIPVYNQEQLIIRCLDSIPKREDVEVVVVDDCSTDNTFGVLNNYKRLDLNVYKNDINRGSGATRNNGIDHAAGEFVMCLDSDDYIDTNTFNYIVDNLLSGDIVYYNLVTNNGEVWKAILNDKVNLCGAVKFIRRSVIGDIRYPEGRIAEDYWFNKALYTNNKDISIVDTRLIMLHYNFPRPDSNDWKRQNSGFTAEDYNENDKYLIEYRKKYGI